jgi:hypothetical protein
MEVLKEPHQHLLPRPVLAASLVIAQLYAVLASLGTPLVAEGDWVPSQLEEDQSEFALPRQTVRFPAVELEQPGPPEHRSSGATFPTSVFDLEAQAE